MIHDLCHELTCVDFDLDLELCWGLSFADGNLLIRIFICPAISIWELKLIVCSKTLTMLSLSVCRHHLTSFAFIGSLQSSRWHWRSELVESSMRPVERTERLFYRAAHSGVVAETLVPRTVRSVDSAGLLRPVRCELLRPGGRRFHRARSAAHKSPCDLISDSISSGDVYSGCWVVMYIQWLTPCHACDVIGFIVPILLGIHNNCLLALNLNIGGFNDTWV